MTETALIKYLQDIVNLETQKRTAGSTYNRLRVWEKDHGYLLNAAVKEPEPASIIQRIQWPALIKKLVIGYFIGWGIAVLFYWIIIIALGIGSGAKFIEIFCFITCVLAIEALAIKSEADVANDLIKAEVIEQQNYNHRIVEANKIFSHLENDKAELKKVYHECDVNLTKMYNMNIVHKQYQDLEPCGMFLQYLNTGRTHSLEQVGGDQGAYNLYDADLKFHIIKSQLDQVLENQQVLYGVLMSIKNNVEELCSSVEKIEQYAKNIDRNTRISAWCNAATAINVSIMERMQEQYVMYSR